LKDRTPALTEEARRILSQEDLLTEIPDWVLPLFPLEPGQGFVRRPREGIPYRYVDVREVNVDHRLAVICTARVEADGQRWIHVSFARPDKVPTWADASRVKRVFVGEERKAVQVMPCVSEHVNFHPHCLHLFACLDRDPLPDFRVLGTI
jgi:hypothetical protein